MIDAATTRSLRTAFVGSASKAWYPAFAAWEEIFPACDSSIAVIFLAESAFRIGRVPVAEALLAHTPSMMARLPSVVELTQAVDLATATRKSNPIDPKADGIALLESGQFEAALHYWSDPARAGARDQDLRIAQATYGLGEYELTRALALKAKAAGRGDRFASLLDSSARGIERCGRLNEQPVVTLPHPMIRDIRQLFSQDDVAGLRSLTALALEWSMMAGDWSDMILMLRRGMFAGDTGLLQDVRASFDDGLVALANSRMFKEVAGEDFLTFVAECYEQRTMGRDLGEIRLAGLQSSATTAGVRG